MLQGYCNLHFWTNWKSAALGQVRPVMQTAEARHTQRPVMQRLLKQGTDNLVSQQLLYVDDGVLHGQLEDWKILEANETY